MLRPTLRGSGAREHAEYLSYKHTSAEISQTIPSFSAFPCEAHFLFWCHLFFQWVFFALLLYVQQPGFESISLQLSKKG